MGQNATSWRTVIIIWASLIGLIGFALLATRPDIRIRERVRRSEGKSYVVQTAAALWQYRFEYGSGPIGDSAQIMAALRGDNLRKIVFFDANAKSFNVQGELIDPWGTPYRFDLSDPQPPRVWSCGKDRHDDNGAEGSDDIASWR